MNPLTRAEKGCIQYDLHQDNEAKHTMIYYEQWENEECFQAHKKTKHVEDYMKVYDGSCEDFQVIKMTKF